MKITITFDLNDNLHKNFSSYWKVLGHPMNWTKFITNALTAIIPEKEMKNLVIKMEKK